LHQFRSDIFTACPSVFLVSSIRNCSARNLSASAWNPRTGGRGRTLSRRLEGHMLVVDANVVLEVLYRRARWREAKAFLDRVSAR